MDGSHVKNIERHILGQQTKQTDHKLPKKKKQHKEMPWNRKKFKQPKSYEEQETHAS